MPHFPPHRPPRSSCCRVVATTLERVECRLADCMEQPHIPPELLGLHSEQNRGWRVDES